MDGERSTSRVSRQVRRAGARRATKIQWTQRTWQVTSGCREWSPGCLHCYARYDARRMGCNPNEKVRARYQGLVVLQNNHLRWSGEVRELPEQLHAPLRWRAPTTVFVNSLSDLFQEGVSFEFIAAVFGVMAMCARHTFQVLTKRPDRMRAWFEWLAARAAEAELTPQAVCAAHARGFGVEDSSTDVADAWPLPNVWVGTSVEDQRRANERVPELLGCPAAVRFLSCEPLLEALDLSPWIAAVSHCASCGAEHEGVPGVCPACDVDALVTTWGHAQTERYRSGERYDPRSPLGARDREEGPGIGWIIVGGESGAHARPCELAWIRGVVAQCARAGVRVFVKQLGRVVLVEGARLQLAHRKGGNPEEWPLDLRVRQMPRSAHA